MSFRMAIFLCLQAGFRTVTSETAVDWHFTGKAQNRYGPYTTQPYFMLRALDTCI